MRCSFLTGTPTAGVSLMVGGISRTGDPVAGQLRSPRLGSGKNKLADGSR